MSDATLTEEAGRTVVLVRADPAGRVATELDVLPGQAGRTTGPGSAPGQADRDGHDRIVVQPGPGEWMLLGGDRPATATIAEVEASAAGEFVTAVDLTHGVTCLRLTGPDAAAVLSTLCAIDLGDAVTPDGAAFRSLVAGVTATAIRCDDAGVPSYLVLCDSSYNRYLAETLTDAASTGQATSQ